MEYAIEKNLDGAARSLGLTIYKRDFISHAYTEIELHAGRWTLLVSIPTKARTLA
jgi:hypothetical protein